MNLKTLGASTLIACFPATMPAAQVDLNQLSTTFANPIGVDYHEPTDSLILSANYSSGFPSNLERILFDGTHVQYSALAGATDELKIATVRSSGNPGGFIVGDLFTGNGVDGQILRITDDGATIVNPWVDLPGAGNGLMRGSLYIDRTGVFGGDLIVATTAGEVWRITAAGAPTMLTDLDVHLEGLVTVPNDVGRFGPFAGTILVGAEGQGLLHSITAGGTVTSHSFGVAVEDIDIIEPNQSFFGVNFGTGRTLAASASSFTGLAGDILLTQETHSGSGLFHLAWDGAAFQVTQLPLAAGSEIPGQWEHVTFAPVGIIPFPECEVFPSHSLSTLVGTHLSFTVTGLDASAAETVTLSASGVPSGAVATPTLPASGNPVQVVVDWTPDSGQVGTHVIVFSVTDASGLTTECPVTVEVGAPPCFTLNFDTDDEGVPLTHGQHLGNGDPEFDGGPEYPVILTSSVNGSGAATAAILNSTTGPALQDPDLLVGTGNLLILQTDANTSECPPGSGIYCTHDDDADGGRLTFDFTTPVTATSVRLVDADTDNGSTLVVLRDAGGKQRTYVVPINWTGDRNLGQPGMGDLDLTTLAAQPGFASSATASEDAGFDGAAVVQLEVRLAGSGGIDDLAFCPTSNFQHAGVSVRNGSNSNPHLLSSWSQPLLGGSWVTSLDCRPRTSGTAYLLVFDSPLAPQMTSYGELLVGGALLFRSGKAHSGAVTYFSTPIPFDVSLIGLEAFAQGVCTGGPGISLSNALEIIPGF